MSNLRPLVRHFSVTLFLLPALGWGQSVELIDAIRTHRATALSTARAELSACVSTKACAEADRLSLLTGFLTLSEGDAPAAVAQLGARPAPKGLAPFHAWSLAEALAWSGDALGALKQLKAIGKAAPQWLKKKADLRTAELLLKTGKPAKAAPLFT